MIRSITRHQLVATVALIAAGVPVTATSVPIQWAANGNYYEYVATDVNWVDANAAADAMSYLGFDGHLLTITSAAEHAFIMANFAGIKAWVGGFQPLDAAAEPDPAAGWQWVTGEAFSYADWAPGQPDDFRTGSPEGEDYLELFASGLFNDAPNFCCQGYFVEYEVLPEPGSLLLFGIGLLAILRIRLR